MARKPDPAPAPETGPVLDLSGPKLRRAFENLVESAEPSGGVERYVTALALKAALFAELLAPARLAEMTEADFLDLATFVAPARRRVGAWLAGNAFWEMRGRLATLLDGAANTATADQRLAAFVASFPRDKAHRWVRDLGAEGLHFTRPELYPLMTRWIWDAKVSTGALREVWFADDPDAARIAVADDFRAFETLAGELTAFLKDQGVFRDLPFYVDLLLAHVYAGYINDRGGQYLRSDFSHDKDPMMHTRRMLGLDAVDTESGRTRLKLIDGSAHVLAPPKALPSEEPK